MPSYPTLDFLPDLTSAQMNAARQLDFYIPDFSKPLKLQTEAFGNDSFAILHSIYTFNAVKGETITLSSVSFFDPFVLLIYDQFGNAITANSDTDDPTFTLSDGIYLSDTIYNWSAPYTGTYYVDASWNQGSFFKFYSLILQADLNSITPQNFKLYSPGNFAVEIGGPFGTVVGSNQTDYVVVPDAPVAISFDGSFNRGGDLIALPGSSDEYAVHLVGSSIELLKGTPLAVSVPFGSTGLEIRFDNGSLILRYDVALGKVTLGNQVVTTAVADLTAVPTVLPLPPAATNAQPGKLFLSDNAEVIVGGNLFVVGTSGSQTVEFHGLGKVTLDGSFNRGNDTVMLIEGAAQFTAHRSGSSVVLTSLTYGGELAVPFGTTGTVINFAGDERRLSYDLATQQLHLGSQTIGFDDVRLFAASAGM